MIYEITDPDFLFNPYDQSFHEDPYPTFDYLRRLDPLHKTMFGTWVVTSYEYSESVLKNPCFEIDNLPARLQLKAQKYLEPDLGELANIIEKWIFFLNPPEHGRIRRTLTPHFTIEAIENLRPYVETIVNSCVDQAVANGSLDIIQDLATPISSMSITRVLGLEEEDTLTLQHFCKDTFLIFDQPASLSVYKQQSKQLTTLIQFLQQRIKEHRAQPRQGVLSCLLEGQRSGSSLTDDEIISTCILLAATSQESIKGLIGNGCLALARHPESIRLLFDQPALTRPALDELLRYDSPIQYVARRASEDIVLADKLIQKGEYVVVYLGAANRDPNVFPQPEVLNFQRTKQNFGFGGGLHHCVGLHLAKLEMEICISSLIQRFEHFWVDTPKLKYAPSRIARRLESLPLSFNLFGHS